MKWIGIVLMVGVMLLPGSVTAQSTLHHTTGLIDMGITDFGSLSGGLVDNSLLPNYWFPIGTDQATPYLGSFSEMWCGDANGHVASALDSTEENTLQLGEWIPAKQPTFLTDGRVVQTILTQYMTNPDSDLPFNVLIDQLSYTWNAQTKPEAAGIVLVKFLITNRSSLDLQGLYFGVAADWDIDAADANGQTPNSDSVEWFIQGQTSVGLDGDPEDGITPVLTGLVLMDGNFRAHRIVDMAKWDYSDDARSQLMAPSNFVVDTSASLTGPGDYMSVISAGPYDIPSADSKSVSYALVIAPDQTSLIERIALAHQLALGATQLHTRVADGLVVVEWESAIAQKTHGYRVLRAVSADGPYDVIESGVYNRMFYEDRTVTNGQNYYYLLMSLDALGQPVVAMGQPVLSDLVSTTPNPLPSTPTSLQYKVVREGIALDWQGVSDAVHYTVMRGETEDGPTVSVGTTQSTRFVDTNIVNGSTYYYSVVSVAESGLNSSPSNIVPVILPADVASDVYEDLSNLIASPNPFSLSSGQSLTFRGLTAQATIEICTPSGSVVTKLEHRDGSSVQQWNGRTSTGKLISPGIYVYQVIAVHTGRGTVSGQGLISVTP